MKLIMYSVREAEKPYVSAWESKSGHEVKIVEQPLTAATVHLAEGYDGVSIQQTAGLGRPEV